MFTFIVATTQTGATLPPNSVNLVYKYNSRGMLFGFVEQISHAACADADKHLDKFRAGYMEK